MRVITAAPAALLTRYYEFALSCVCCVLCRCCSLKRTLAHCWAEPCVSSPGLTRSPETERRALATVEAALLALAGILPALQVGNQAAAACERRQQQQLCKFAWQIVRACSHSGRPRQPTLQPTTAALLQRRSTNEPKFSFVGTTQTASMSLGCQQLEVYHCRRIMIQSSAFRRFSD